MWLPYNGKPNQIRVDHEKDQKYIVTKLEGENEPIAYNAISLEIIQLNHFYEILMQILHPSWKFMLYRKLKTILK